MTASPALIDTNIPVYAFDRDSGRKNFTAKERIGRSWRGKERYAVSTQNLAGFSVVVREKVAHPVPSDDVRQFLSLVMRSREWQVPGYTAKTIIRAHEIRPGHNLHFRDALPAAAREENSVRTIMSEDAHFRNIPWITVQNPFP